MKNKVLNKLSKIVSNAVNEAFDFNEVNNTSALVDNDIVKLAKLLQSLKAFTQKYFNCLFNKKDWHIHYNKEANYFILFPKIFIKDNNECEVPDFIENIYRIERAYFPEKRRKYCDRIYNKITKEIIETYTNIIYKPQREFGPAACIFYSKNFMIFTNEYVYPMLIYIKPTTTFDIDISDIDQTKYFSSLFLSNYLKHAVVNYINSNIKVTSIHIIGTNKCLCMLSKNLLFRHASLMEDTTDDNYNIYKIMGCNKAYYLKLKNKEGLRELVGDLSTIKRYEFSECISDPLFDDTTLEQYGVFLTDDANIQYHEYISKKLAE